MIPINTHRRIQTPLKLQFKRPLVVKSSEVTNDASHTAASQTLVVEKRLTKDRRKRQMPVAFDRRKTDRRRQRKAMRAQRLPIQDTPQAQQRTIMPLRSQRSRARLAKQWQAGRHYQPGVWIHIEA